MAITVTTPSGVQFTVAEPGEPGWGKQHTDLLIYLSQALVKGDAIVANEIITTPHTITVNDGATLDTTNASLILVSATTGTAKLNVTQPLTTPVNLDGKRLTIIGMSTTNPVTIPDTGNMDISGPVTLHENETIDLVWLDSKGKWLEVARNN